MASSALNTISICTGSGALDIGLELAFPNASPVCGEAEGRGSEGLGGGGEGSRALIVAMLDLEVDDGQ
jgi:hypothetical protein